MTARLGKSGAEERSDAKKRSGEKSRAVFDRRYAFILMLRMAFDLQNRFDQRGGNLFGVAGLD